jgi:hypothetical protein
MEREEIRKEKIVAKPTVGALADLILADLFS